jgi:hypothetical protein
MLLVAVMLSTSAARAEPDSTRSVVLRNDVAHDSSETNRIHPVRFAIVTGGVAATIATIHIYQANGWWKGNSSSFHFQEDLTYGRSVDKLGHFYAGTVAAFILREAYGWAGLSKEAALYWGSGGAFLFQTYIEVTDGFHTWGFDRVDFAANLAGAAWPIAQYHSSLLRNFDFKFSYHPSQVLNENCGIGFQGQKHIIFDDYEGQTLWLSAKVKNLLPESWKFWPTPLQLSLGYRVRDVCAPAGSNRKPYSALLLALDLDMTKVIPDDTAFLRLLGNALNFIKFPMPAVQISPDAIWYGFYF